MVQAQVSAELQANDYLWPLTTIRDTLLRPDVETQISPEKLEALLRWHLIRLQSPWRSSKPPSTASRTAVNASSLTIPNTSLKLEINDASRSIVLRLSEVLQLDELESFLLFSSYSLHSIDDAPSDKDSPETIRNREVERLTMWYTLETLAVPQIVIALLQQAREGGEWNDVATGLRADFMPEPGAYMEGLFRGWSVLAQKRLEENKTTETALFWATHQLQLQEVLLDLLFLVLYTTPDRAATISEGLLRGAVMSHFGTDQANREIWENNLECNRLQIRIRDLILIIAVEGMGLAQIVSEEQYQSTLLQSRDRIHSVHQFVSDSSEHLVPRIQDSRQGGSEISPIAIICLAWSIVLQALPDSLLPPAPEIQTYGTDESAAMQMAGRALRLNSSLFPWLEEVLSGPLFEPTRDVAEEGDLASFRRNVIKDLLVGLSELVHVEAIPDQPGLYRSWELLFGGGTVNTSLSISVDFWNSDFHIEERRAILDKSCFPREFVHLPKVLASLTGLSSLEVKAEEAFESDPVARVCEYFHSFPSFTHTIDPSLLRFTGKDSIVEAAFTLSLPGGAVIPRGSKGTLLRQDPHVVSWRNKVSGWGFLVEILRVAAGLPPTHRAASGAEIIPIESLGVNGQLLDVLVSGLKLLGSVLRADTNIAQEVMAMISTENAGESVLELVLAILSRKQGSGPEDLTIATYAVDILQALLATQSANIWSALRSSNFFETHNRRRGIFACLIQSDSSRGEHTLIVALLRLVSALTLSSASDQVLQSALQLVFTEVWSQFFGWRYRDVARKYEIASLVIDIFDNVLRHPISSTGSLSGSANFLIDALIISASPLTYKPLIDIITQAGPLATRLFRLRRSHYAIVVNQSLEDTVTFIATLLRVSAAGTPASALPKSLFAATIAINPDEKLQLVDYTFDLVFQPSTLPSTTLAILRLLRTYVESISSDSERPSLAGLLRDAEKTCSKLARIAVDEAFSHTKAAVWQLLASVIATQPGCAPFCIGAIEDEKASGALQGAVDQILDYEAEIQQGPHSLAAALSYCIAVLECPGASKAVAALRLNNAFWTAVYALATRSITSFHSAYAEVLEIQQHAYIIQVKANATSLLAVEIGSENDDEPETKARSLVLSLFRNTADLSVAAVSAVYTTCEPELHENQARVISEVGSSLQQLKTIAFANERDYGPSYLYDGRVTIPGNSDHTAAAGAALDALNLNWSLLDADIAFTKAFRALAESVSAWTEGDGLAAKAALRAAVAVAEELSLENRGGDVMLAIQVERLTILSVLLDTALAPENDEPETKPLGELATYTRTIIQSSLFPPIISLRHADLPAIHKPILRILFILLQSAPSSSRDTDLEFHWVIEAGVIFALDAAAIILDLLARNQLVKIEQDLGLVIGILCEISKSPDSKVWLNKVLEYGLIGQTLEVISRVKIDGNQTYISSILLLHLALASQPASAEALAVSGILPVYSDNSIATEAEQGRIKPGGPHSVHGAWCGMLLVVKALLSSLPSTASFARSEVIPFIRVSTLQMLHAMSWDGESPLSQPVLNEMELVVDVLYGLARAVGPVDGLLRDYGSPSISLLKSLRYALSHPRQLSTLIEPASEEEQADLELELASLEETKSEISLLDFEKTPILASRTHGLLRVCRTVLSTLVTFTRAWVTLAGDEEILPESVLLIQDDEPPSASSDPVGVINDIFSLSVTLANQFPKLTDATTSLEETQETISQLLETAALLSLTQLIVRHSIQPQEENVEDQDSGMDVDAHPSSGKRRVSLGKSTDRQQQILRELQVDLLGMLPSAEDSGSSGIVAENRFLRTMRDVAEGTFGLDS